MSKDEETKDLEVPRAIVGAGGVAPNYAALIADDVETRAGGVAFNYAAPVEPLQVIEASESTEPTDASASS